MEKAGLRLSSTARLLAEPVYVDREMWEKIVLNLLSNAFKFTFEGEIALTLKTAARRSELAVRDTGVGIPEHELPRVFERFHRIEGHARPHLRGHRHRPGAGAGTGAPARRHRRASTARPGREAHSRFPFHWGTAHLPAERIQSGGDPAATALPAEAYVDEAERWLPRESGADTAEPLLNRLPSLAGAANTGLAAQQELLLVADDNADMRDYLTHLLRDQYRIHAVSNGRAGAAKRPATCAPTWCWPTS